MIYPILIEGEDDRLRQVAQPVKSLTTKHQDIFKNMKETMKKYDGVGLAATQVGIMERYIIVSLKGEHLSSPLIMINPEIVSFHSRTKGAEEGCLSMPDFFADVERPIAITVKYKDQEWHDCELKLEHFNARVVQHEVDHLNGILFIDRIGIPSGEWKKQRRK